MEIVKIYTDGACSNNGKANSIGGIGVVLMYKDLKMEISEGYKSTTNNRMELLAVIRGLQSLKNKGLTVEVYSDSKYVVDSINKGWLLNWEKKGFNARVNADLWIIMLKLYREHKVTLNWVKGHASNEYNNICDRLAVSGSKGGNLKSDRI